MTSIFHRWKQDISWNLTILSIDIPEFSRLSRLLVLLKRTVAQDEQGSQFISELNNMLTTFMVVPCIPQAVLHDTWLEDLESHAEAFRRYYPGTEQLITETLNLSKALFVSDSIPTRALEHIFLDSDFQLTLDKAVFGVRYIPNLEAVQNGLDESGLNSYCRALLWKELKANGSKETVIMGGPIAWHHKQLLAPPSQNIIVVTPSCFRAQYEIPSLFALPNGKSFSIDKFGPAHTTHSIISAEPVPTPTTLSDESEAALFDIDEAMENPDAVRESEEYISAVNIHYQDATVYLGLHKHRFITSQRKFHEINVRSSDDIETGWYHLTLMSKTGESVLPPELKNWQSEMASWKAWLKKGLRTNYKSTEAQFLNAGGLKPQRFEYWALDDTISPQSAKDFRALLTCSQITNPKEQDRLIQLGQRVKTALMQQGREQVAYEYKLLEKHLEQHANPDLEQANEVIIELEDGSLFRASKIISVAPCIAQVKRQHCY